MEETTKDNQNDSNTASSIQSPIVRQTIASPCVCVVCGDVARYSYFGAVVCISCKVFFRRNARSHPTPLICKFGDHCEINVNTRRACSSCRLAKCFASGMSADLIRSSLTIQRNSTTTDLVRLSERNEPEQIPTLNLLRSDQSTLTGDQWNNISNITHCFDEYNGLEYVQQFIDEQNALPPKFRYKYQSVNNFFISMLSKVQIVFEKNRDLLNLSHHDRKILLENTIAYTTGIGEAFLFQQTHLLDDSIFSQSAELILRSCPIISMKRLINQFDLHPIVMKIFFSIISFLLSNYTCYKHTPSDYLNDRKSVIQMQDKYTELAWRYLIYKLNYQDAVLCFTNFLRCLFLLNDLIVKEYDTQEFNHIMNCVIQSTEQKLNLDT